MLEILNAISWHAPVPKNSTDQTCSSVRETGVSRRHGSSIEAPTVLHSIIVLRGLRGALYWAPVRTRDAILSDS